MSTLQAALEVAIEAARGAGELIRQETWRADGPRGGGHHADVDDEAEALIRARLLAAFPTWSYHGEETGTHHAERTDVFWLVDPNDGTAAFLRGFRASAVSIALIQGGVPVLGVVYAPCYPDDDGDLIAWAEGCGPLTRNGRPLDPSVSGPFPDALMSHHIVMMSQAADSGVAMNMARVAPARYRALTSIAYRLALVAVGEAEAAISLAGAGWLDFAGGHALLRARGGEVCDESGRPLRYPRVGNQLTTRCFGSSIALCGQLAQRDWTRPRSPLPPMSLPFPVNLPKQRRRLEPALLSRAQGCMLGQLAGDALGSRVEFLDARTIRNRHGDGPSELQDGGTFNLIAGQPTDDSELALALARTLIRDGEFNQDAVFESYRAWFHSQPFDVGTTTSDGLSRKTPKAAGANATSEANGALMRVSPLGIAAVADLERAATWAAQDAVLTHPHPLCQEASSVFVRALGVGIAGGSRQDMYRAALDASTSWTRETLERASFAPPPEFVRHQGWVRIALHNAFYRLLHAPSLEAAIIETVREGGDTDTNAAIAGALCGAFHGREAVPPGWRRSLLSCRPTESYEASIRPRPAWCWPVDALEVAERLLTL